MEVGTVKTEIKPRKIRRKRSGLGGFGNGNGGRNDGGGGNNGGDDGFDNSQTESYEKSFGKSKIFTWFLLIVVMMTFGGANRSVYCYFYQRRARMEAF